MEKADLFVELKSDCNAAGSCSWSFGGAYVVASIYGPKEANLKNELTHRAFVEVIVHPASGLHSPYESEMESYLSKLIERIIDVKFFPRSQFTVRIQLISGSSCHPVTMAACINAVSLALLQTSIQLKASIVAICTTEINPNSRPITVTLDMAQPGIVESFEAKRAKLDDDKAEARLPGVFSIYCGRLGPNIKSDMASFTPAQLLCFTSCLDPQEDLCKRARDLFDAMIEQLTASMC